MTVYIYNYSIVVSSNPCEGAVYFRIKRNELESNKKTIFIKSLVQVRVVHYFIQFFALKFIIKNSLEKRRKPLISQGFSLIVLFSSAIMEVTPGFEPGNNGFADRGLTTWLCHLIFSLFHLCIISIIRFNRILYDFLFDYLFC